MDLGKGPKMRSASYAVDQIDPAAIQPERPLHHKEYRKHHRGNSQIPGMTGSPPHNHSAPSRGSGYYIVLVSFCIVKSKDPMMVFL